MARAYGQRPSTLLGVDDPLAAYQFDHAVFSLEEAIDGALGRVRHRLDLADLDAAGRRKVRHAEGEVKKTVDLILGVTKPKPREKRRQWRPVVYLWNEDHTVITGFRYADEVAA